MLDAIALPVMALLVVAYLIYIWNAWLKDKNGRALNFSEDDNTRGFPDEHD